MSHLAIACRTGVIFLRFSGERRQARGERESRAIPVARASHLPPLARKIAPVSQAIPTTAYISSDFFEEPVARTSPSGFSMGILAICFSLFCYSFIFYILIDIYLVTMCKNNGKKK